VFSHISHWMKRSVGLQGFIIVIGALLMTRLFLGMVDRMTFDPVSWGYTGVVGEPSDFESKLDGKITTLDTTMLTLNPDRKFRITVSDTTFIAVTVPSEPFDGNAYLVIVRRPGALRPDSREDTLTQKDWRFEVTAGRLGRDNSIDTVAESSYDRLTGVRRFQVRKKQFVVVAQTWGDDNPDALRWLQIVLESAESSARASILLSGYIQALIYLFSFMALGLVALELMVVWRSRRTFANRLLLPNLTEVTPLSQMQSLVNSVRGERMKRRLSDDICPNVVLDLVEPGYKLLMSYRGEVNAAEVHTILDTSSQTILEKLNTRFQILRYFVITLPSLGFIGTVLGIGEALSVTGVMTSAAPAADRLLANYDLSANLHVAFDTTLVGLVASIAIGFVADLVETRETSFVLRTQKRIMENIGNVRKTQDDTVRPAG